MTKISSLYPEGSVFTVPCWPPASGDQKTLKSEDKLANDPSFELAVVEFNDDGSLVDPRQKTALADCITAARRSNPNGAMVVTFIHGWHHGARWDDGHHVDFRKVLAGLALRETERYGQNPAGRRVIGIYLGWQGDPATCEGLWRSSGLTNLSFFDRIRTAERIGGGDDLRMTIREIIACTKNPLPGSAPQAESPLTLLGHSMGALMLETAFLALLTRDDPALVNPVPVSSGATQVTRDGQPVTFPDVIIALNSAADSRIMKAIIAELERRKLSKSIISPLFTYCPPLLVSATAADDRATKLIWRLAPSNVLRTTDGHDQSLFTHTFAATESGVSCIPKPGPDLGQDWSCLRHPEPVGVPSPVFPIDLPEWNRSSHNNISNHTRYQLKPLTAYPKLAWVFQVPSRISAEHNDIFNTRCSLLILALMQIAGATMSLAKDWEDNFEAVT